MNKVLASPYFLNFVVPLITVLGGVFLKFVSRNDKYKGFQKEDLAIGLDVSLIALILFITESVRMTGEAIKNPSSSTYSEKLVQVPWTLFLFVILIWSMSTVVRKLGWQSEVSLKTFWGIVIPNIFGLASLIYVVSWLVH